MVTEYEAGSSCKSVLLSVKLQWGKKCNKSPTEVKGIRKLKLCENIFKALLPGQQEKKPFQKTASYEMGHQFYFVSIKLTKS